MTCMPIILGPDPWAKRAAIARDGRNHYGIKVFNMLPGAVKGLFNIQFKNKIKKHLREKAFYSKTRNFCQTILMTNCDRQNRITSNLLVDLLCDLTE